MFYKMFDIYKGWTIRKVMGGGKSKNINRSGDTEKKNSSTKKVLKKIRAETFIGKIKRFLI
jgi:hypothetical protein